jgi:hypothetical protein
MSRDRFLLITSFLHLSNNDDFIPRENPGHDPLFKLGPIFKHMISRFNSAYIPHQNISLDEGMIPGVEVTGSVLQYSLMSDCEIIPIARISAMLSFYF